MSKKIKFTEKDLEVMKTALGDILLQMNEDLATHAEKAEIIIPLIKIEQLLKEFTK